MRARLAADFERFRAGLPRDFAAHVREAYGIDLTARFLGYPLPHPIGKGSGQLSLNPEQLETDRAAGLAVAVARRIAEGALPEADVAGSDVEIAGDLVVVHESILPLLVGAHQFGLSHRGGRLLLGDGARALVQAEGLAAGWKIRLKPRPNAPVVWGSIYYWVRKADYLPARVEYYDERGTLMRTMEYSGYRTLGGRTLPTTWAMISNTKKNHRTEMTITAIEFDVRIPDRIFSFRELERGR